MVSARIVQVSELGGVDAVLVAEDADWTDAVLVPEDADWAGKIVEMPRQMARSRMVTRMSTIYTLFLNLLQTLSI